MRRGFLLSAGFAAAIAGTAAAAASIETVYQFSAKGTVGVLPDVGLVAGPLGLVYGATGYGPSSFGAGSGAVFQLALVGGKVVATPIFGAGAGVAALAGSGSALYVALVSAAGAPDGEIVVLTPPAEAGGAWQSTPAHVFAGGLDGATPVGLMIGPSGVLYGTTSAGGNAAACGSSSGVNTGCGTVFRLALVAGKWQETVLYRFTGGSDGALPAGAPTLDPAGDIYVSTTLGGNPPAASPRGAASGIGIIGELVAGNDGDAFDPHELYHFTLQTLKYGAYPAGDPHWVSLAPGAAPPRASAGNAALATATGGGNTADCGDLGNYGCGAVFQLSQPASGNGLWSYTALHSFIGTDGYAPAGALFPVGSATLYGIAGGGPPTAACQAIYGLPYGCGVVYRLTKGSAGWRWGGTVLDFSAANAGPLPRLLQFGSYIVGVSTNGGPAAPGTVCGNFGCGTVFVFKP